MNEQEQVKRVIAALTTKAMSKYLAAGEFKTLGTFNRQLWHAALDFYRGDIDAFEFIDDYTASIENQLTRAWNEGAAAAGVDRQEMTSEDLAILQGMIQSEYEHILGLAGDLDQARLNLDLDEFRQQFKPRVQMWGNRYNDARNRAITHFGGKLRLEWVMGATEDHCGTCGRLNGIVAWASEWEQSGVKPQSPPNSRLQCGGWRCACILQPTDRRRSPRALERIMSV
jgi:hypothetical protein